MGAEQALAHAEALRRAVQELAIAHERSTTAQVLSISVGLACVKPAVSTSMSLLYERADKALYRAKAKGRNQVVQWEELN
jgi:diguanylate cyclase (GGDEF)-like protein